MQYNFEQPTCVIGVHLPDYQDIPPSGPLFAKVVLIDRSEGSMQPLIYQLKNEPNRTGLPLESGFLLVGEFLALDKTKKQITFRAHDAKTPHTYTIRYDHLIVASGFQHPLLSSNMQTEFATALQALDEALRVAGCSQGGYGFTQPSSSERPSQKLMGHSSAAHAHILKQIRKMVDERIQQGEGSHPPALQELHKRLFELQV